MIIYANNVLKHNENDVALHCDLLSCVVVRYCPTTMDIVVARIVLIVAGITTITFTIIMKDALT